MIKDKNLVARIAKNKLVYILVCVLSGLTAIPLLAILGEVLIKGWSQLGWSFLTEATPNAYKALMAMEAGEAVPGGIANGIVGTFLMLLMASIVAIHINMKCFFSHTMHLLTASLYEKRCTPSNMPAKGRNKLQKNAFYSVTFAHPISKVFCMIFRQISRRGSLISKNRKFSANH